MPTVVELRGRRVGVLPALAYTGPSAGTGGTAPPPVATFDEGLRAFSLPSSTEYNTSYSYKAPDSNLEITGQVSVLPFPVSPKGGTYTFAFIGKSGKTAPLVVLPKVLPTTGDNLLWKQDPEVVNATLDWNKGQESFSPNGNHMTSGYLRVVGGSTLSSNKGILSANFYNAQRRYIGEITNRYLTIVSVPAAAVYMRVCYDGIGTWNKAGLFMGNFGGGQRISVLEPFAGPWHQEPALPAAKSRSTWNIKYLGVLGSTTADPRYSKNPESGYNAYRAVASSTYGLVCAKGFNENAPVLVVHPWDGINQRLALYTNINAECPDVATNGTHAFALLNGNPRATYTQKWIGVFHVASQTESEITGGTDLVGYNGNTGDLKKTMGWQGHQVPNPRPDLGENDFWKHDREVFINTWKYSGIAAEMGLNKLVAVSCAEQGTIDIRRFPNEQLVQTIAADRPRRMCFTEDGALWVVCGEDYATDYMFRSNTTLKKYVSGAGGNSFAEVASWAIPFLSSVSADENNGVLIGLSGTTQQYQRRSSAGAVLQTHGQLGGNVTSAVVNDYTYTLLNHEPLEDGDWNNYVSGGTRGPDRSWWLLNAGGFEIKHWNAELTTLLKASRIGYLPDFFTLAFDRRHQQHLYGEMYRLEGDWNDIRSFQITRNWRSLLPKYLLSPHCAHTYTSQDGTRESTVVLCQDTRFNEPNQPMYPNGSNRHPGYQCEMVLLPQDGSAPVRSSQWFDFEPYTDKTWTLYPEGIRTFHSYYVNGVGWKTRVLFRPYVDLDINGFPVFGPEQVLVNAVSRPAGTGNANPMPRPGWNRQFTCAMLPNGVFPGLESAYQPLGAHHLGYYKIGVPELYKKLLPNASMKNELVPGSGIYSIPGYWPDINTDVSFGGHFSAGVDVAGPLCYVGQDGQFSKYKSNTTQVYDLEGNFIMDFGRLMDDGPGFDSQNMDAWGYGNNCGQMRVLELDNGDHIVLRCTENGGGYSAYRNEKPTMAMAA